MREVATLALACLLVACTPKFLYSRSAVHDEKPFDAEVRMDVFGKVEFSGVGAIVVGGRNDKALEMVQCLSCHRMAEHPPVRKAARKFDWKRHDGGMDRPVSSEPLRGSE